MDDNPFLRLLGVELTVWQPDLAELQCELRSELLNRSGALQGGGRKVFFACAEAFDAEGNLVASGQTAHKYV